MVFSDFCAKFYSVVALLKCVVNMSHKGIILDSQFKQLLFLLVFYTITVYCINLSVHSIYKYLDGNVVCLPYVPQFHALFD